MPSVGVKLHSLFFKLWLKHRLLHTGVSSDKDGYGLVSRPESTTVPPNSSFVDGVATKDVNTDPSTSVSLRIFLPKSALPGKHSVGLPSMDFVGFQNAKTRGQEQGYLNAEAKELHERWPAVNQDAADAISKDQFGLEGVQYHGYSPQLVATNKGHKKLPIVVQFHGGAFVLGSKDSTSNDLFCRRMAKACNAIVVAVGYRLAPEHKYPAAFEDGYEALLWLARQANLAECINSSEYAPAIHMGWKGERLHPELVDSFGHFMVEPWLAAHGDSSRCVLLGVGSGANIADYVARQALQAKRSLDPLKIVAQVLMYPFFLGKVPTRSEIKLSNAYFYDKDTCILAWKLFLSNAAFDMDHPAANPLLPGREPPLKQMPPTLTVVAELDWMKDRAIAYSEALRKVGIDAPVLEYKDAVHGFATLDGLVNSRQAESCAEDMAIWIKKHVSVKGTEFSY